MSHAPKLTGELLDLLEPHKGHQLFYGLIEDPDHPHQYYELTCDDCNVAICETDE